MKELVIIERPDIVSIADSIRNKTGQNEELTIGEIIDCINNMGSSDLDTSDATATSDDILAGETAYVNGEKVTGTFTLDAEITTQEEKLSTQDTLITSMMAALEGKASSNNVKTTKTIHLDWSQDEEVLGEAQYISSDGQFISITASNNIDTIEAEHGIVFISDNDENYFTNGFQQIDAFISYDRIVLQTQTDGETIYFVSSMIQQ